MNDLTVQNNLPAESAIMDVAKFDHLERVAKMLTKASMLPEHFQGERNIGNVMFAIMFAVDAGLNPVMAMQKMFMIKGKAGIESQLAVTLLNRSGLFSRLQYKYNDSKTSCYAYATEKTNGQVVKGMEISLDMAKRAGWLDKPMSQWKIQPALMLLYRAGSLFVKQHAPHVLIGLSIKEELEDSMPPVEQHGMESNVEVAVVDEQAEEVDHFAEFNKNLPDGIDKNMLDKFINETAALNETDQHVLIMRANENMGGFLAAFDKWVKRNSTEATDIKLTKEYQSCMAVESLNPELYEVAVLTKGKPETVEACNEILEFIKLEGNKGE